MADFNKQEAEEAEDAEESVPDAVSRDATDSLFSGISVPLIMTNVNMKAKKEEEKRLEQERKARADAEERENELRKKLLHEREVRLKVEADERKRQMEAARVAAELEAKRRYEREQKELEERLRRQRQEEWENKVEHLKQEIKKQQIKIVWNRWQAAYLARKEEQRKIEAVRGILDDGIEFIANWEIIIGATAEA